MRWGAVSSGTETILFVEDEEGVRDLVRDFLEMDGYTVFTAPNGKVALQVCAEQKKPFDLLITDVVMPEMGGPELVAHLRKSRPEWKVLFTSGYVDRALAHDGTLDPDVHFIQKPFTPENLARKVRDILDAKINKS